MNYKTYKILKRNLTSEQLKQVFMACDILSLRGLKSKIAAYALQKAMHSVSDCNFSIKKHTLNLCLQAARLSKN